LYFQQTKNLAMSQRVVSKQMTTHSKAYTAIFEKSAITITTSTITR